jgi:hypothetical protein
MQCLGKLDGPECRIENKMDIFILPIIFSIRAAITILLLLRVCSIRTFKSATRFTIDFIQDLYRWILFLLRIAIFSYTGRFWWSILQVVFIITITLDTFFQGVYDFGPKHRKRSFFDIMSNPVPSVEFEGRIGESNDCNSLRRRRFNHKSLLEKLHVLKLCLRKESRKAMLQSFTIVHVCTLTRLHRDSSGTKHT